MGNIIIAISIHALREEGDSACPALVGSAQEFLSTPSARRATKPRRRERSRQNISIHALREEGDAKKPANLSRIRNFYPRPPRGGRRPAHSSNTLPVQFLSTPSARRATRQRGPCRHHRSISIHALREEGDNLQSHRSYKDGQFLSTPSARRATAKTETKSLFSNKLYNILHEFRRALIYNGSKNYPNHAKRLKNPVRRCRKDAEDSPFAPGRKTQNNSRPSCSKGG